MKRKLLVIDTETGGLDPDVNAILSLGAVVMNEDGDIEDTFYCLIDDRQGKVEPDALQVNGLEAVNEGAESPAAAYHCLELFLLRNGMEDRVRLAGHNLAFDQGFLCRLCSLAGRLPEFHQRFYHGGLDTKAAALVLEQAGRLKLPSPSASLDDLTQLFGVPLHRDRGHNALEDARATAQVLQKMVALIGNAPCSS